MKASNEKNVSAQQTSQKKSTRIPYSDENRQWTESHQPKTQKRKKVFGGLSFPKSLRLRKRTEFLECKKTSCQLEGKYFYLQILPSAEKKLGITASGKFGNAVQRNCFKRHLREIFRKNYSVLPHIYIHVIARKYAQNATQHQLQTELMKLIARACS